MGIYHIQTADGSSTFELSATVKISKTQRGKISEHMVGSGDVATDNYVSQPDTFSFEGVITDLSREVKSLEDRLSGIVSAIEAFSNSDSGSDTTGPQSDVYVNGITRLKESKELFNFHFGGVIGTVKNCLFESIEITQDLKHGTYQGRVDSNSFKISAKVKQVRIAQATSIQRYPEAGYGNNAAIETEDKKVGEDYNTAAIMADTDRKIEVLGVVLQTGATDADAIALLAKNKKSLVAQFLKTQEATRKGLLNFQQKGSIAGATSSLSPSVKAAGGL